MRARFLGTVLRVALPIAAALAGLGCDPFHVEFDAVEAAEVYRAVEQTPVPSALAELRVMTWNVKFGGGRIDFFFDCFGDRVLMDSAEVRESVEGLAAVIRAVDPDILLLQEVDVNSKRSVFIDQLQLLLDSTPLNHGVYASQWRADYVPSDGLGAVDNGNAILSRWPLLDAERVALPLRADQGGLTRYFYLRRNYLRARVAVPGVDDLWVVNIHTDAYGEAGTKQAQIGLFEAELRRLVEAGALVIGGGDLNTIPPGSRETRDFPDSVCTDEEFVADDYTGELDTLDTLYADFEAAVPLSVYEADNSRYFTHTVDGRAFWNRKLDYLFTNGTWVPDSGDVLQSTANGGYETMPLSDHAPLLVRMAVP